MWEGRAAHAMVLLTGHCPMLWKIFSFSFSVVSTGSGWALLQVSDVSATMRIAAKCLVYLGLIIALPNAVDASQQFYKQLGNMGVWSAMNEWNEARKLRIQRQQEEARRLSEWEVTNVTSSTLYLELSDDQGGTWPGNSSSYILNPGQRSTFDLQCRRPRQVVCYGAWVAGNSVGWGIGPGRTQSCNDCCRYCGDGRYRINLADR